MLPGGPHVIDGEVCVLDDFGGSDFKRLHERAKHRRWFQGCEPVTLCAFDLLFEDGRNVMSLPLMERKARLARLVQGVESVILVDDLPGSDITTRKVKGAQLVFWPSVVLAPTSLGLDLRTG